MAGAWEQRLPEVIRTPAVVSALRAALEAADGPSRVAAEAQQPSDADVIEAHDLALSFTLDAAAAQPTTRPAPPTAPPAPALLAPTKTLLDLRAPARQNAV